MHHTFKNPIIVRKVSNYNNNNNNNNNNLWNMRVMVIANIVGVLETVLKHLEKRPEVGLEIEERIEIILTTTLLK